jgi:hypothetical protein
MQAFVLSLAAVGDIDGRVDVNIKKFGDVLNWFGPMVRLLAVMRLFVFVLVASATDPERTHNE